MGTAAIFNRGVRQEQLQHDRGTQDDLRKQQQNQYDAVRTNIQGVLASGVDPHTQQPLTPDQIQHLQNAHAIVTKRQADLLNPNFDPTKGEVPEDPLHKLTTKVGITQDTHPSPAQQISDLNDIVTKYGAPAEVNPMLKSARQLREAGFTDEEIKRKQMLDVGMIPKPNSGTDFDRYLDSVARDVGKTSRLEMTPDEITDARRAYANAGRTTKETFVPDATSSTGYAKVGYDAEGSEVYRIKNAVPPRGVLESQTTTTDPFGVSSTSTRKPVFPGAKPSGKPMSEVAPGAGVTPTGVTPTGKVPKPVSSGTKPVTNLVPNPAGNGLPPLDNDGHIPATAAVNPRLRQAANNILDGMDVQKLNLPLRDATAAQDLAEKYGYKGQGTFTPKEQIMLREASTFIDKMANSKSLATLDEGFFKQLPMVVQASDPAKEGLIVKFLNKMGASKMTDAQTEFMQNYRQVVGTISGLSQLVRSNRATEATINRLIAELPNPYNTKNAQDAEGRLKRLKQEISVALEKGRFEVPEKPAGGGEFHYHVNDKNELVPDAPQGPQ